MNKFIFIVCSLIFVNGFAFGQNSLEKDLSASLKKYDLIKLDKKSFLEKAKTGQTIEIRAYEQNFAFVLTPNDLRAKNYRAVERTNAGDHEIIGGSEVFTFKGALLSQPDSEIRFTANGSKVEGLIYTNGKKFFIVQADEFTEFAQKDDVVVYAEGDLNKTVNLSEDVSSSGADGGLEQKINQGVEILKSYTESAESAAADLKILEVATEADYQWVLQAGGAAAANNEILGILNLVDGIYQRDLNLTVKVTYQHAWSSADSYSTTSTQALLDSFLNYWNANYSSSQFPRDVAHLFTGKFSNQGIAYSSVTCRSSAYAYGLTARTGNMNHLVSAHEIGHNLGAGHIDNSGACVNSVMNPFLGVGVSGFCETSKSQINSYVASYGTCLSSSGTTNPPPSCTYSISPNSQFFSYLGGAGSATVTTQSGCGWTAGSNQSFVSITSGSSGSGSGTVAYYVAQNGGTGTRSASLTIAGQTFTIQQNGITIVSGASTRFDFDGDGRADISVFRPSNGTWYINQSSVNSYFGKSFGQNGDLIAPADFDGDKKTDTAVFRPSNGYWYYVRSSSGQVAAVQFGQAGDKPVAGDFDGDGRADIAVFRPSNGTWYRLNSSTGQFVSTQFGQNGDVPVVGDFDGDGRSDAAVFRPSAGTWYILRSSTNSFQAVSFGQAGDIPTAADFDGDKKTDVAVYRPGTGTWYRLNSSSGAFFSQQFGAAEDRPAAADFDGDGRADLAAFRPSSGNWYFQKSSTGFSALQFGAYGDVPASSIIP